MPVDALQGRNTGPLAIRSGDGDDAEGRRAHGQRIEHGGDSIEAHVDLFRVERFEPREPIVERGKAFDEFVADKTIRKTIVVPGRLVNIVV